MAVKTSKHNRVSFMTTQEKNLRGDKAKERGKKGIKMRSGSFTSRRSSPVQVEHREAETMVEHGEVLKQGWRPSDGSHARWRGATT